jgi:hypothetical protein
MSERPRIPAALWALTALLPLLCLVLPPSTGCDALVGGECLPGYEVRDRRCVKPGAGGSTTTTASTAGFGGIAGSGAGGGTGGGGASSSGAGGGTGGGGASSSGAGGGTGGEGGDCQPPLVLCPDGCVDLLTDPKNCGSCGHLCPTEICLGGKCTGEPVGHLIVIGMSYAQANAPTEKLLGNAVFLPPGDPVRVLDYRKYASPANTAIVDSIISAEAKKRSRTYGINKVSVAGSLPTELATGIYDVFLIHDQPTAPSGQLAALGTFLAAPIKAFALLGGTIVVLASNDGIGQMDQLLTASQILATEGFVPVTGQSIHNQAPNDVLGNKVPSPFLAKPITVRLLTSEAQAPNLTYVFTDTPGDPVVVHKALLP